MSGPSNPFGRYTAPLILEPLADGRRMKLYRGFGFVDSAQRDWPVPAEAIVDGASIPRALWSVIGGPFEGKYRDASVIHDYYCDVRTRAWREVHRVFYDAMRASEVSELRAKIMYAAVYYEGPRWNDTVVHNSNVKGMAAVTLGRDASVSFDVEKFDSASANDFLKPGGTSVRSEGQAALELNVLAEAIAQTNPSLDEIDDALDRSPGIMVPPGQPSGKASFGLNKLRE